MMVDFQGMALVTTWGKKDSAGMVGPAEPIAWWKPSAELSLGGLRPRRARLRFTRHENRTARRIFRARSVGQPIGKSNCR